MREEYNIMNLKPRKNPYVKTCKKQDTINPDENVTSHLKNQSKAVGISHQSSSNLQQTESVYVFFTG